MIAIDGARVDGQRQNRTHDRFRLRVGPGALLVARLGASEPLRVDVRIDGQPLASWQLGAGDFQERRVALPASVTPGRSAGLEVVAEADKSFAAAHFWIYTEPPR